MTYFEIIAAAVVGVVSAARVTRLITQDTYPPVVALRMWWARITNDGPWEKLVTCPWCASPYITAIILAWGLLTDFQVAWWVVNGWLAAAYLASMVVVRDGE
jgi:hypothetical protein